MYNPSEEQKKVIKHVYDEVSDMLVTKNKRREYFNDRTLEEFIDDNEFRFTGYAPTREEQGKEDWQANVFHPVTRNKTEALLAAVALDIPEIRITAQDDKQKRDQMAAYVMRHMVKGTYNTSNKEEQTYFEALECCVKGTVITYNGYVQQKAKRKIVKSFDQITGEVEYDEEEINVRDECVDFIVPLENVLIKDVTIRDIQQQPSIAWIRRMSEEEFDEEFSKYSNYKHVKTRNELTQESETERYFIERWSERTKEDPIEVIQYYNKFKDEHIILANGVLLLESPLLLGKKVKMYPFSKTIFKPFAQDFFYGNSLPNSLMGEQDVINALYNMAIDKTYRSAIPPLLIGDKNKDDFDLDDEIVENDTKIYVRDINDVREMPISGVDGSMFNMMDLMSRGLDLSSVDSAQQGVSGGGATAREVVIANENAKKLKGVFYMFLTHLWQQKVTLRIYNILVFLTQPKIEKMIGKNNKETQIEKWRKFIIEGAELSDGGTGTLGIQMVGSGRDLPKEDSPEELDKNEIEQEKVDEGKYEEISITSDYLDDWQYDIKVVSESLYQKESSLTQAKIENKIEIMGNAFPQYFQMNQEKLFKDAIIAFDDDPDEYQLQPPTPELPEGVEGAMEGPPVPGEEMATAGQAGLPPTPEV